MPTSAIPLLPCPWCGSENVSVELGDCDWFVQCLKCGSCGPSDVHSEAQVIADWNKGPYADRFEIHAEALRTHAFSLQAKADEHLKKAAELLKKAETAMGNAE